jgi:hypothetical protein
LALSFVDPGGSDIGVAEPFLHLGDIGLVIAAAHPGAAAGMAMTSCSASCESIAIG